MCPGQADGFNHMGSGTWVQAHGSKHMGSTCMGSCTLVERTAPPKRGSKWLQMKKKVVLGVKKHRGQGMSFICTKARDGQYNRSLLGIQDGGRDALFSKNRLQS